MPAKLFLRSPRSFEILQFVSSYDEFINELIKQITLFLNFEIGHYYTYVLSKNELQSSGVFFCKEREKYSDFIDVTRGFVFQKGEGLPGSAWEKEESICFPNVYKSTNFPRAKHSPNLRIKAAEYVAMVDNSSPVSQEQLATPR